MVGLFFTYLLMVSTAHFFLAAFRRPRVPRHQDWMAIAGQNTETKHSASSSAPLLTPTELAAQIAQERLLWKYTAFSRPYGGCI